MVHKCVEDLVAVCRDANSSTYSELETLKAVLRRKTCGPRKSESESMELLQEAMVLAAAPFLRADVAREVGKLTFSTLNSFEKRFDASVRDRVMSLNAAFLTAYPHSTAQNEETPRVIAWIAAHVDVLQTAVQWAKEHQGVAVVSACDENGTPEKQYISPQMDIMLFFAPLVCTACKEFLARWDGVDKSVMEHVLAAGLDFAPYCLENRDVALAIFSSVPATEGALGEVLLISNAVAVLLQKKRIQGSNLCDRLSQLAKDFAAAAVRCATEAADATTGVPESERSSVSSSVATANFTNDMVVLHMAADHADARTKEQLQEVQRYLVKTYQPHLGLIAYRWEALC